jgi:peptide/nickel transport system substrate-binding protein
MEKYINLFKKDFYIKKVQNIENIISSFSLTEKVIFGILVFTLISSTFGILIKMNNNFMIEIPEKGGVLTEGIIGTPKFINPIISVSNADKDLTSLIYSGLTTQNTDGEIIPNLAERFEVSEDNLEYRFFLKENIVFHDKTPITTDDVIFTVIKIQDPVLKSSKRATWQDVVIEKINDKEILFKLNEPKSDFLQQTDFGILPKHIWENITSQDFSLSKFNTEPIGSGPFELKSIKKDKLDIPVSYTLVPFKNYSLGEPFIEKVIFKFAKNEDELLDMFESKKINSISSISPNLAAKISDDKSNFITLPLPRIFGVFLNPTESPALNDKNVRQALNIATPKEFLIENILFNFAEQINSPLPIHLQNFDTLNSNESELGKDKTEYTTSGRIERAKQILEESGWEKNDDGIYISEKDDELIMLSVSISTGNVPELIQMAEEIKKSWQQVGVNIELKIFETSDLNQNVIRPRNFESLLFGIVVNKPSDLYSFWHSSQREDPGLNITNYANITTDNILEKFKNGTSDNITNDLLNFQNEIYTDNPAIFLYSPKFIYILPNTLKGVGIKKVHTTSDRFINIHEWFIETNQVWEIFNK